MGTIVDAGSLAELATQILRASGIPDHQAVVTAEHMAWADTHGRANYGVWRLPILCKRAEAGVFQRDEPVIEHRGPSLAVVDGRNAIGHYVATLAADLAIEKAGDSSVALVAVHSSNFMGALGYYADRMARRGMAGLVLSNAHPRVAAHGGTTPVLGTNPLAFAVPVGSERSLIVDMATAAGAGSLITKSAELGIPLPEGIAVDRAGKPITDASKVSSGAMLPMAGPKGYGLALMVEVLAGVLTGAGISHGVHSMYKDFENPANIGHVMIAIDISSLLTRSEYDERMDLLIGTLTGSGQVRIPGDARGAAWDATQRRGGVELDDNTVLALQALADKYGVTVPWSHDRIDPDARKAM